MTKSIKFNDIINLIERLKKDSFNSLTEDRIYFPPQGVKVQEVFERTLSMFENDFLKYYYDLTRATPPTPVPQESIFDTDGWCWDMSLVPKNTWILGSDGDDIYYGINDDFWTTNQTGRIPVTGWTDTNHKFNKKIIAWQPLPTLPKETK